jgi:hypothetical protein
VIVSSPEAAARLSIEAALAAAGWVLQDVSSINLYAGRGIAVREFPLKSGYGFADYLLFVDGEAVGAVEAKTEGETLTGVEVQTAKYADGLRDTMTAPTRPLPFLDESTGMDRGKPGSKYHLVVERQGIPLAIRLSAANVHDATQLLPLLDVIPPIVGPRGKLGRPR